MSTLTYAVRDSATMLRRNLRHMLRYPSMTVLLVAMPVIFLLLFVYVFGGTLGDGLGGSSGGRADYVDYVTPGILLMAVAARRPGHRDLGRHGHDRGHHRPVPHHGDLPGLGADRARRRQRDPDDARHRASSSASRCSSASGPPPRPLEWLAAAGVLAHDHLRAHLAVGRPRPGEPRPSRRPATCPCR